jgi:hypothetical protein
MTMPSILKEDIWKKTSSAMGFSAHVFFSSNAAVLEALNSKWQGRRNMWSTLRDGQLAFIRG